MQVEFGAPKQMCAQEAGNEDGKVPLINELSQTNDWNHLSATASATAPRLALALALAPVILKYQCSNIQGYRNNQAS